MDTNKQLTDEHFYHLDVHLNVAGNRKLAALVADAITRITSGR